MNKLLVAVGVFLCLCQAGISAPPKPRTITREMAPEVFDFKRIEELAGLGGKTGREGRRELFEKLFGEKVEDGLLDRLESTKANEREAAQKEYTDKFLKLVTTEGREGLLSLEGGDTGDLPLVRQARGLKEGDIATPRAEHKEFGKKLQIGVETAEAKFDSLAMANRLDPSGETAAGLREFYKQDPDGRTVRSVRDLMRTDEANRAGTAGEVEGTVVTGPGGAAVTRELPAERRAELRNIIELLTTDTVLRGHLTPTDVAVSGGNARVQAHDHALAKESALSDSAITWTGFSTMSKLAKDSLTQALKNKLRELGEKGADLETLTMKQLEAKLKSRTGENYDKALKEVAAEAQRLIGQGVLSRLVMNAVVGGKDGKAMPLMDKKKFKGLLACAPAAVVLAVMLGNAMVPGAPLQAGEKAPPSDKQCSYDIHDPDGVCFDKELQEAAREEYNKRQNGTAGDPSADALAEAGHKDGEGKPSVTAPRKRPTAQ